MLTVLPTAMSNELHRLVFSVSCTAMLSARLPDCIKLT